jgi:hypothetical protein
MGDIMRNLAIGGAILVVLLGGVVFFLLRPFHHATAAGTCPPQWGTGPPSPVVLSYSDQFLNLPPPGSSGLTIKPRDLHVDTHPGLCIDQGTGDIHLYHKQATRIQLTLTIDPSLNRLNLHWPADANAAFDVSPQATYQPPSVSGDQKTLTVFLLAKDQGQKYPYVATYLDGQDNPFHTEPGIQNH